MNDDAISGLKKFVGDVLPPGTHHLVFVRSPHAHARLVSVDAEYARRMKGVSLVLTGDDLDHFGSLPSRLSPHSPDGGRMVAIDYPVLARQRVRFAGEAVAAVIGTTAQLAADAAETVEVVYEDLPSASSIEKALSADAPEIWPEFPGNICFVDRIGDREAVDNKLAASSHVTKLDLRINRVTAAPLETRRALAVPEENRVVLHAPVQAPHQLRDTLADHVFKCPHEKLRVLVPAVGGGFGMKGSPHPEYAVVVAAALRLGRPVFWESTRSEGMLSDHQGRDAACSVEIGFDGMRVTAIHWRLTGGLGAYLAYNGIHTLLSNRWGITGLYSVEAVRVESRGVMINTAPVAPYRGAGRPEATMTIERAMDVAAREMGVDPWELRRRNLSGSEVFPLRTALGLLVDTADPLKALEKLESACDRAGFARRKAQAADRGRLRGLGLAHFMEIAGGPPGNPQSEGLAMRIDGPGSLKILAGTVDCGQGHDRLAEKVIEVVLGPIAMEVEFCSGDTDLTREGVGTFGSRSAMVLSHLIERTSRELVELLKQTASDLFEAALADIDYDRDGARFSVIGTDRTKDFASVVSHHMERHGPIALEHFLAPNDATCPYGFHSAEVEIDPDTGNLFLCAYNAVDDVGRPLDHSRIASQLHGGIAQGFGQAVMEAIRFDPDSGQPLSGSLLDYAMPRADDLCFMETDEIAVPAGGNTLGVKGVGEAGAVAALSAVANAVHDALADLGIRHVDPPYTPNTLWRVINEARSRSQKTG